MQVQSSIKACEYKQSFPSTSDPPANVKGRLRANLQFWKDIGAPAFILDTIQEGYKIPFRETPVPISFSNNASSFDNWQFVFDSITQLLQTERVAQVQAHELIVCSPLSVATQPRGKKRLILDLRYVNSHVYKQATKFEDWRTAFPFFDAGSYFTKFDLKSGYHHLDIFSQHQSFLGSRWNMDGATPTYFMFTVLPFGLTSAPFIFTKVLRPLVRNWRSQGISTVVYLDDGFDIERSLDTSMTNSRIIRSDLRKAGFITSEDKCMWHPTQLLTWLGLDWNGLSGTISITPHRIDKVLNVLQKLITHPRTSARKLASAVGMIISMGPVMGNLTRIMTRHCQMSIAGSSSWDSLFDLDRYCILELEFWQSHVKLVNCRSVTPWPSCSRSFFFRC